MKFKVNIVLQKNKNSKDINHLNDYLVILYQFILLKSFTKRRTTTFLG